MHANLYRIFFWIVAHLVYDAELSAALRDEALVHFKGDTLDESSYAKSCPKFESLMLEVMRVFVNSGFLREVVAPVQVGGKCLDVGSQIVVSLGKYYKIPAIC